VTLKRILSWKPEHNVKSQIDSEREVNPLEVRTGLEGRVFDENAEWDVRIAEVPRIPLLKCRCRTPLRMKKSCCRYRRLLGRWNCGRNLG